MDEERGITHSVTHSPTLSQYVVGYQEGVREGGVFRHDLQQLVVRHHYQSVHLAIAYIDRERGGCQ